MKKLLSLVLVVCMLMSAFGAVTAFGASGEDGSYTGGGAVGGGSSSSVIPSTPSIGGGGSSSGGSGGSSSGGSGGSSYQAANWELYSNGVECNSGAYHPGDLVIDGNITTISGSYDIFVIIAQYDDSGALIRNDIRRKTVSAVDTSLYAELNDVDVNGIVKCMVIRADNLKPITPSKIYIPFGRSMIIDISQLDSALIGGATDSIVEYYASRESSRTDKIYVSAYPAITVNGVQISNNNQFDLLKYTNHYGQVRFIENTGDNSFDAVAVTIYEYGIVEEVIADKYRINFADGNRVFYDPEDAEQVVNIYDKSGKAITLNDIKPGDVLAMVVGELQDYVYCYPLSANAFMDKLTIYNLGDNRITGVITGWDSVAHQFYIDGVLYEYCTYYWVSAEDYNDLLAYGGPLGVKGDFYLDINGRIIGFDGSAYVTYDVGLIVDSQLNTGGFEPQWKIKLLTKDGIGVYNVDTQCEIDGVFCDINSDMASQNRLDFSKYSNGSGDEFRRSIEYETNKNGEIDTITFLENKTIVRSYSLNEDSYNSSTNKLGSRILSDKLCIFNVTASDIEEATVEDISALIDDNPYSGTLIDMNNDKEMDFFIATSGELSSDNEPGGDSGDEPGVEPVERNPIGFIVNTYMNTNSFEPYWQIKLLSKDDGEVDYNVRTKCIINDTVCDLSNSYTAQDILNVGKYNNTASDSMGRIIEYEVDGNGEINKIYFMKDTADCYAVNEEFSADTSKLGSKKLDEAVVVFDVSADDDYKVTDLSGLTDKGLYEGVLADCDGDAVMDAFVMTSCALSFDAEACLYVVDSVIYTIYDGYDAVMVNYYTDGENELKSVYFTDDSNSVNNAMGYDFSDLTKGDLFTAIINDDNLVTDYAIVAKLLNNSGYVFDTSYNLANYTANIYGWDEVVSKGDKVEFIYGFITELNGKTVTLGGTAANDYYDSRLFCIDSNTAQYCYNTNGAKPTIDVGEYRSSGVDEFDASNGKASLVFMKVYDEIVTDIITFTQRVSTDTPGIIAQTHYTGPGLDLY